MVCPEIASWTLYEPNVTDITYIVFGNSAVATQQNCLIPAGKQVSMKCGYLFLSTVSPLVEACKQGMHSALSSRYRKVGSAFLY